METTLTIRLPKAFRQALKRRAISEKKSEAAVVREILSREMDRGFEFERVRHLVGSVSIDRNRARRDDWAEHLRKQNWRE